MLNLICEIYKNTFPFYTHSLTHWRWMTHIWVSKLTIIGSDNGLSPGRRQAIIWNNAVILLIAPLGTNFSEILIKIQTFSFKKIHLKMSSRKWRPFCLGLNVLTVRWCQCLKPFLVEFKALLILYNQYCCWPGNARIWHPRHGVGVTKAPFVSFSIKEMFDFEKKYLLPMFFESLSYLTGVTAA